MKDNGRQCISGSSGDGGIGRAADLRTDERTDGLATLHINYIKLTSNVLASEQDASWTVVKENHYKDYHTIPCTESAANNLHMGNNTRRTNDCSNI